MANELEKDECLLGPYRVLDLTDEKGFLCGKIMGDLGAEVIKIEKPRGDPSRRIGPFYHDTPDPEKSLYWFAFNMNKRGITLDIETADGQAIFKKLVKSADIVVESFPLGYMDKLGLGYQALSEINPGVVMTSITPFGQMGPYKDYRSTDIVSMAMGGNMYSTGEPDRGPVRISFPQSYLHAGVEGAIGSLTALHYRQMTGEGQHVDLSIQDTMVIVTNNIQQYWAMNQALVQRGGPGVIRPLTNNFHRVVSKCKDGYVTFRLMGGRAGAATTRSLLNWMDEYGMAPDFAKEVDWDAFDWSAVEFVATELPDRLFDAIDSFFLTRTKAELLEEGVKRRLLMYPVCTAEDIRENPQLEAREFWEDVEHRELGTTITYPGAFFKSSETPWRVWRRAPLIGEHNEEVYEKELGFAKEDLVILKQAGVI